MGAWLIITAWLRRRSSTRVTFELLSSEAPSFQCTPRALPHVSPRSVVCIQLGRMVPNAPLLHSKRVKLFAFAAAAALHIPISCLGWWDAGHMLTVAIASQRLSNATVAELNHL